MSKKGRNEKKKKEKRKKTEIRQRWFTNNDGSTVKGKRERKREGDSWSTAWLICQLSYFFFISFFRSCKFCLVFFFFFFALIRLPFNFKNILLFLQCKLFYSTDPANAFWFKLEVSSSSTTAADAANCATEKSVHSLANAAASVNPFLSGQLNLHLASLLPLLRQILFCLIAKLLLSTCATEVQLPLFISFLETITKSSNW